MERTLLGKEARYARGLQQVGEGVFAWLQPNGEWGESNAGVVVGDGEALLIDTLFDTRLTQAMLDAVGERVQEPIRTLVNTHSDGDHVFGNQLLPDAEIVATAAAAAPDPRGVPRRAAAFQAARPGAAHGRSPARAGDRQPRRSAPAARAAASTGRVRRLDALAVRLLERGVTPPTREFGGELTLDVGGREVRLIEVGPAHTAGDLIVHVPDASVVFAADVLFVDVCPVMWAGPTRLDRRARRILELQPETVVPGHGPVSDQSEVQVMRDYMEWVEAEARPRLAGEAPLDVARELLGSEEYRSAPWDWWDSPERIVITIATIDRHRKGGGGSVSARAGGPVRAGGDAGRRAAAGSLSAQAALLQPRRAATAAASSAVRAGAITTPQRDVAPLRAASRCRTEMLGPGRGFELCCDGRQHVRRRRRREAARHDDVAALARRR